MAHVRPARRDDVEVLARMRFELWPEDTADVHRRELERFFERGWALPSQVFVAEAAGAALVGFAEVSVRAHAEGCSSEHVGYLEGWYVIESERRTGAGRALALACESWARAQGCSEMGSDALPENDVSAAAHEALGFEDAGLVRCFYKKL